MRREKMKENNKKREKIHKITQKFWREIFSFSGEFKGTLVLVLSGAEPGSSKKVITKKFGDKTINVIIEIEDPDEPKGIL